MSVPPEGPTDRPTQEPPASDAPGSAGAAPVPPTPREEAEGERESPRRGIERLLPELIRRGVEAGIERLGRTDESLRSFVAERKLPKEIASYLLSQVDETKNALLRVVAKEIRDFLEHTNLSEELRKALTSMRFEIKTEIGFVPAEPTADPNPKPEVKTEVKVRER
jgi:hypothetical protein